MGVESDLSAALQCAVSVEAIHAASLVHDDLPALDNDDYRRGRPSVHRAFNEATAILVGDLLVGAAFKALFSCCDSSDVQARLYALLAQSWTEVCVGQQLDLQSDREPVKRSRMVELKTGALFGFACASAGLCAGCSQGDVERLRRLGVRIGVVFQRLDDATDGDCSQDEGLSVEREQEMILQELQVSLGREMKLSTVVVQRIITAVK
jgi:farnesyl diphosphate synthase